MRKRRLRKRQTGKQRQGISKTHRQTPGYKQTSALATQKRETHEYTNTQMKRYSTISVDKHQCGSERTRHCGDGSIEEKGRRRKKDDETRRELRGD